LVLVINAGVSTTGAITVQLNADGGTNYSVTRFYGDGSTATSDRFSTQNYLDLSFFPNTLNNNSIIHFMNYSNTTTNKTVLARWNSTSFVASVVGLWRNTAAVNSIKLFNSLGYNLITGSTFTLYGIKAA
jgi:hypothetical protein